MYGKLFTQMYDGTLATKGPWQALVTFQQMIILADQNGVVDMTAEAIARRTTLPLEIIQTGIAALEQPDDQSRTPDLEGRRIVRLDSDRSWGWHIVNHAHYRKIRSQEERREYMRKYQREYRAKKAAVNTDVNNVSKVNQSSKQYAVSSMQEKAKTKPTPVAALPAGVSQELWAGFRKHRQALRAPMTDRAESLLLKRLQEKALLGEDCTAIIEQSIEQGWKGLFSLRAMARQGNTQRDKRKANIDALCGRGGENGRVFDAAAAGVDGAAVRSNVGHLRKPDGDDVG